jgi:hypothetical protein
LFELPSAYAENPSVQLATLRGILQRIAQAKPPADFAFIKQVLLEHIADLEEQVALTPIAASSPDRHDLLCPQSSLDSLHSGRILSDSDATAEATNT